MYNRIILVGRLTKDPELRYTPSGKAVAGFRLAVDRGRRSGQDGSGDREADFIDVVVWDRQAETVSQYLTKGRLVLTEGRLQMRQYDAQDGSRRTVYEVIANTVRFMPDRHGDGSGTEGSAQDFHPDDDDDVPF